MDLLHATAEQRQNFEVIFKKAATDGKFRQQLLAQPRKAVRDAVGVTLPESYNIKFIETPKGVDSLVPLPDLIDENVSLTEDELEAVACGNEFGWCCGNCSDCSACSNCSAVSKTAEIA